MVVKNDVIKIIKRSKPGYLTQTLVTLSMARFVRAPVRRDDTLSTLPVVMVFVRQLTILMIGLSLLHLGCPLLTLPKQANGGMVGRRGWDGR